MKPTERDFTELYAWAIQEAKRTIKGVVRGQTRGSGGSQRITEGHRGSGEDMRERTSWGETQ